MVRQCSNGHITGARECPQCGFKNVFAYRGVRGAPIPTKSRRQPFTAGGELLSFSRLGLIEMLGWSEYRKQKAAFDLRVGSA